MRVSAFHRSSLGKGLLSVIVGFLNLGLNNFIHFFSIAVSKMTAEYATNTELSPLKIYFTKSHQFLTFYIFKSNRFKKKAP